MYLRRVSHKCSSWDSIFYRSQYLIRSSRNQFSYKKENNSYNSQLGQNVIRNFHSVISSQSKKCSSINTIPKFCSDYILDWSSILPRFYSSEGDKSSGGKHVAAKDTSCLNVKKLQGTNVNPGMSRRAKHVWLGEQDQNEWIKNEELAYNSQKMESTFLTKREKFRNDFMRKVVPWEKISVSWDTFPYYINKHTKKLLTECAASRLKCKRFTSSYGAHLNSSSGRILLQGIQGTELYRERIVRALARDLQVPLLVIDNSVHTSYGLDQEFDSDTEAYDEDAELGEEYSQSEVDEVSNEEDSEEVKSDESEEDNIDEQATAAALEKLVPCIDEYAKRVSGEYQTEASSAASLSNTINSAKTPDKTFRKGDRVKYIGSSSKVEANNRILLGKITTPDGPTNAYMFLSGRSLQSGQRGEVYEVNGDQVAVILDSVGRNFRDDGKNEKNTKQDNTPSLYWIDVQDIDHDSDLAAQGWYIAVEALCEVLLSLEPIIVYFPDSSQWLSGAVPMSRHKEFIQKLKEMFDELSVPIIFIYGKTKDVSGPKPKKKLVVLSQFGRPGRLPVPLHQLAQALQGNGASKKKENHDIINVFPNTLFFHPPEEEMEQREFFEQLEVDKKYIITRNNLVQLRKVLDKHQLSCTNLLHIKTDGVIFTKQKAKQVAGWARNYYLSSCISPSVSGDKLTIPQECFDTVISRLRDWEDITKKPSQDLKNIAKDDYERNFISAVVPPSEIGVKFEDIGALEDVKKTLNELVTLPMRRPELFSRGNLLRPCKGILLFGPPGTGKTLLAKALATEAGANFISITGSTITSKWFGDAEKLTKALFSFASKLAPVIIFVDEVDSLLGARGGASEHESTRRMRNEFMAAWDGLRSKDSQRIIVLGATNRPFDLDDAVIRRLPRRIYVDLPNSENRIKILKIFLQRENIESNFRYDELANATDGYSGSDLKNLCIAAAYRPVQELLEEEKRGDGNKTASSLRPLNLDDFIQSKSKVGASVAYDASSMNDLRKWNEQYGEGGSRKRSPFGFGSGN